MLIRYIYLLYFSLCRAVKLGLGKSFHTYVGKERPFKKSSFSTTTTSATVRPPLGKPSRVSTSRRPIVGKSEKPKNGKTTKSEP